MQLIKGSCMHCMQRYIRTLHTFKDKLLSNILNYTLEEKVVPTPKQVLIAHKAADSVSHRRVPANHVTSIKGSDMAGH